jgi:hypothetical protein
VGRPLQLSPEWALLLQREDQIELGAYSQARLLAAGVDPDPSREKVLASGFDSLGADARRAAIEAARSFPIDAAVMAVLAATKLGRLSTGSWLRSPPWFLPIEASRRSTLVGTTVQHGSMVCLDAALDLPSSLVTITLRSLPKLADHLAADVFAADPPAPDGVDASTGWRGENGGPMVAMGMVWPHGRNGARSEQWQILTATAQPETAVVRIGRDYGSKRRRVEDLTVSEAELAVRLQELFDDAASDAHGSGYWHNPANWGG